MTRPRLTTLIRCSDCGLHAPPAKRHAIICAACLRKWEAQGDEIATTSGDTDDLFDRITRNHADEYRWGATS